MDFQVSTHNFVNPSSRSIAGRRLSGDGGRNDVVPLCGHGRVAVTDTRTRQVKGHRIRVLAEVNQPLAVKRHRGARATLDKMRSISCVPHPSLTH